MATPNASGGPSESPSTTKSSARELAHDLSNALEIVMQTSFLLGTLDLGESGRKWHSLLEAGIEKTAAINRQLREVLRQET
jgi:hypothetical protein